MRLEQSIIEGLTELGDTGAYLRSLIRRGVISTVDTQMIINQDDFHAIEQGKAVPADAHTLFDEVETQIERTQSVIAEGGLYNGNFHALVTNFGKLLFTMIASKAQQAEVTQWHEQGIARFGGFLMADGGGASIQQWHTVMSRDGEMLTLDVDKVWIIEGHRLDYGSVSSASAQKLYPVTVLIPPQEFNKLKKTAIGEPFLGGSLQLGNISGKVTVPVSYQLSNGGLASTSIFLSKIRPRFVRALMAHVQWLNANREAELSSAQLQGVRELEHITTQYYHNLLGRKPSLPMALAIKFTSNCILQDLVFSESVKDPLIQRDLMAFTRMEGSSYRCLFEICGKVKVR